MPKKQLEKTGSNYYNNYYCKSLTRLLEQTKFRAYLRAHKCITKLTMLKIGNTYTALVANTTQSTLYQWIPVDICLNLYIYRRKTIKSRCLDILRPILSNFMCQALKLSTLGKLSHLVFMKIL